MLYLELAYLRNMVDDGANQAQLELLVAAELVKTVLQHVVSKVTLNYFVKKGGIDEFREDLVSYFVWGVLDALLNEL